MRSSSAATSSSPNLIFAPEHEGGFDSLFALILSQSISVDFAHIGALRTHTRRTESSYRFVLLITTRRRNLSFFLADYRLMCIPNVLSASGCKLSCLRRQRHTS